MNGSGGDNRVYGVGAQIRYRYPATWKIDMRLGKSFDLGHMRQMELLAESFNLFNHQNVTELETTGYTIESGSTSGALPTLNFPHTAEGQHHGLRAAAEHQRDQLLPGAADTGWSQDEILTRISILKKPKPNLPMLSDAFIDACSDTRNTSRK